MNRCIARVVAALAGATVLILGGNVVASASVTPPAPPGSVTQHARDGTSAAPVGMPEALAGRSDRSDHDRPAPNGHTRPALVGPAPDSRAASNVLNLEVIDTCLSCTASHAGAHSSHGHATAIRLLGHDIAGGEQEADGANHGALLALPANPLLNVAIADWEMAADQDALSSSARSRAALLDLSLLGSRPHDALLTLSVLESTSSATWTGLISRGHAEGNGVELTALHEALVVILLHSETSSEHRGSSYVLSINGNRILQSDEMGDNGIPIEVPGVLRIILLQVTALGGGAGTAGVGTVTTGGNPAETAGVVNTSSDGGPLVAGAASGATPAGGVAAATGAAPTAAAGGAAAGHLHAPTTGASLGMGGFLLVLAGTYLVLLTLRRRRCPC